jgi:hypothetical protein
MTADRILGVLLLIFSVVAFVLTMLAANHGNYPKATFDLLLAYGCQWQARIFLDGAK